MAYGKHEYYTTKTDEQREQGLKEIIARTTQGSRVKRTTNRPLTGRILYPIKASTT